MNGYKLSASAGALMLALGAQQVSAAPATIVIPGVESVSNVAIFDWSPSNVLALNGNQAIVDWIASGGACTTGTECVFDIFAHGSLSAFQDAGNNTIPSGLGTTYQVTFQMGFGERVNAVFGSTALFGFGPDGATSDPYITKMSDGVTDNFFRMYVNTGAPVNDPLTGSGFDAGSLVFEGTIAPVASFVSNFSNTTPGSSVPLGGQGGVTPAAWGGQLSVAGVGASSTLDLLVTPTTVDYAFFGGTPLESFLISNIGQALPYTTVDPSLFYPEGAPLNGGLPVDANAGIGVINGGLSFPGGVPTASGPSIVFQSDPNSPIAVPEPASLALLSLGLLGAGAARRRFAKR